MRGAHTCSFLYSFVYISCIFTFLVFVFRIRRRVFAGHVSVRGSLPVRVPAALLQCGRRESHHNDGSRRRSGAATVGRADDDNAAQPTSAAARPGNAATAAALPAVSRHVPVVPSGHQRRLHRLRCRLRTGRRHRSVGLHRRNRPSNETSAAAAAADVVVVGQSWRRRRR